MSLRSFGGYDNDSIQNLHVESILAGTANCLAVVTVKMARECVATT